MTDNEKAFRDLYAYMEDGDESHFKDWGETKTPNEKLHGKVIECRCEAFHDVTVYEDGYEEYNYIGD